MKIREKLMKFLNLLNLLSIQKKVVKPKGVEVICDASEPHNPLDLKGFKLADCSFQTGSCTGVLPS